MTHLETRCAGNRTLAELLSEGPIPVEEGLRYAMLLAEALRKLHDNGKAHGAVSPEMILITAEGIELAAPREGTEPGDIPRDIFDFGTVLGQMLAPKPPVGGEADGHGAAQDYGLGALIAACVARDPADRMPNMRRAQLELKLASLSARHSGVWSAVRTDAEAAIRAEVQSAEIRQEARLKEHENRVAEREQQASELLHSMRADVDAIQSSLTDVQRDAELNSSRLGEVESGLRAAIEQLGARLAEAVGKIEQEISAERAVLESVRKSMAQTDDLIGRVVEAVETRLASANRTSEENARRLEIVERSLKETAQQNLRLEAEMASGLFELRSDLEARDAVVQSVRKSTAQTDDLVGRVVEAVESLLDLNGVRR
jgi:hypothetical protein